MARPHPMLMDVATGQAGLMVPRDPDGLVDSALEHHMNGLLWSFVERGVLALPRSNQHDLARHSLRARAHHDRLWDALHQVDSRLGSEGIQIAVAKGVAAEARWYDRQGERPCADLDLLLDPAQIHQASRVVSMLQAHHPLRDDMDRLASAGLLQSVDILFHGVAVDLHFDVLKLGVPMRDSNAIWGRTAMVSTPWGQPIRALDAEMSLVMSLLHALKDRFSYLLSLVDVVRIVDREELDWGFIDRFLSAEGMSTVAYSSLDAVYESLGLAPPRHPDHPGWRSSAWHHIWPSSIRLQGQRGRIEHHRRQMWIPFLMNGRQWDAIRASARIVVPPRSLMDYYFDDTSGPYPIRLAVGRLRRARERHQKIGDINASRPGEQLGGSISGAAAPVSGSRQRYKAFPPSVGQLKIPVASRSAARAAIAMYSASRGRALAAQRAALMTVAIGGPRVLPGRARTWTPPQDWPAIADRLMAEVGPYDSVVIHERSQPDRLGLALLLVRGPKPLAFVKLQPQLGSGLLREEQALAAMHRLGPMHFSVPEVLAAGTIDGWRFLVLEAFPAERHRPPRKPPLRRITAEVAAGLCDSLPRGPAVPQHWTPMHGDLTPWNLREFSAGRLLLVDWEEAGWAPPGADEVLYRAAEAAVTRRAVSAGDYPEATAFWMERLSDGTASGREGRLQRAMLRHLGAGLDPSATDQQQR